jgi:hypothetical protein
MNIEDHPSLLCLVVSLATYGACQIIADVLWFVRAFRGKDKP